MASSTANALAPRQQQQRRVPPPTLPLPPSTIDIPQPVYGNNYPRTRSPSPLRSGFKVDPNTGEIQSEDGSDGDDDNTNDHDATWGRRSHSPNPSITKFASSFAQRVGSFVSSVGSAVPASLPTDEELEREAERDRERSRREAERILTREAEERRIMEEKVFSMLNTTHGSPKHVSPARSQSMPSFETPSPTASQRESGITSWWSAAKNRLTPTKEPLTAAQQVIQEAKEKEKREKKEAKKSDKDKRRSGEWPSTPENKFTNPAFLNLASPSRPSPMHSANSAPSSPTPGSQNLPSSLPASLAPSPLRPGEIRGASPSRSPSRDPPPLYAQFNEQGTLDVPGTLLVIARRFEKLEKWTVGHVRALEERMSDVERWLVDKENEKENTVSKVDESSALEGSVNEMRDELMEMQGRIGELGREVAKLVTAPAILSSTPSRVSAQAVSTAPQTNSSFAIHAQTSSSITVHSHSIPPHTPQQPSVSRMSSQSDLRRRDSISPPFVPPSAIRAEQPRSRLPYPTGDYTSPQGSVVVGQSSTFSPPQSPPPLTSNSASASPSAAPRSRPVSVAGLPGSSPPLPPLPPPHSAPSGGLPRAGASLVAPPQPARPRSSSISPTPRKRYTVALGEPIMKPRMSTSPPPPSMMVSSGGNDADDDDDACTEEEDALDRTIGRSAGRVAAVAGTTTIAQQHRRDTSRPPRDNPKGYGALQQQQQQQQQHHHHPYQHRQQQHRRNGLGLGIVLGGNGDDTDTSADSAPARSPPRRPRAQTSGGGAAGAVSAGVAVAAAAGRTNPLRLRSRAQSSDRAMSMSASAATMAAAVEDEPRTPWSSTSSGFRDPLVVRREELEARAKAVPAPPKVISGRPRAPVGEMVAFFDKS
ncbi:hypothetical protein EI94DRAFT_1685323 [Lactarius quietus]|nr:hypothetical protein EI94DRAFT_1685323 [Lactarius quietus]